MTPKLRYSYIPQLEAEIVARCTGSMCEDVPVLEEEGGRWTCPHCATSWTLPDIIASPATANYGTDALSDLPQYDEYGEPSTR